MVFSLFNITIQKSMGTMKQLIRNLCTLSFYLIVKNPRGNFSGITKISLNIPSSCYFTTSPCRWTPKAGGGVPKAVPAAKSTMSARLVETVGLGFEGDASSGHICRATHRPECPPHTNTVAFRPPTALPPPPTIDRSHPLTYHTV